MRLTTMISRREYRRVSFWKPLCRGLLHVWQCSDFPDSHVQGWREALPTPAGQRLFLDTLDRELADLGRQGDPQENKAVWLWLRLSLTASSKARAAAVGAMQKVLTEEATP